MRRVRTSEGSQYYGLPVGAPITLDAVEKARERNGGKKPPKGASVQSSAVRQAPAHRVSIENKNRQTSLASRKVSPQVQITPPSRSKPKGGPIVKVGSASYKVDSDSRTFTRSGGVAQYNVDAEGKLRVLTPKGEAKLTPDQESRVKALMVQERETLEESDAPDSEPPGGDKPKSRFDRTPEREAEVEKDRVRREGSSQKQDQERQGRREQSQKQSGSKGTGVFNEHDPNSRTPAETTPLTEKGFDPEEELTVYRGVPKDVDAIGSGDWVTADERLAKDYAGDGKVVSMKVKAKDLLTDPSQGDEREALLSEMVYQPTETDASAPGGSKAGVADAIQSGDWSGFEAGLRSALEGKTFGNGFSTSIDKFEASEDGRTASFSGQIKKGDRVVGNFDRAILDDGTVAHRDINVDEDERGQGFAKAFSAATEKAYRDLGVNRIIATASADGAYVWAKAGYEWNKDSAIYEAGKGQVASQMRSAMSKIQYPNGIMGGDSGNLTPELRSKIQGYIDALQGDGEPPNMKEVADLSTPEIPDLGRRLLNHTSWPAKKDLSTGATTKPSTPSPKERNPSSLGESVRLAPKDYMAMAGSPLTGKYITADGDFTPERKALHDKIVSDFLDGVAPVPSPVQYMNGGGPASGKGTMTRGDNARITGYPPTHIVDDNGNFVRTDEPGGVIIDPDQLKLSLPEGRESVQRRKAGEELDVAHQEWAANLHEESSYLAKRLHQAALDRGVNLILDGVNDTSVDKVRSKVDQAHEHGYSVEANYIYLDPEEGLKRAAARAARSGRNVPSEVVLDTYENIPEVFDGVKTGVFDKIRLFDNNVSGQPGRLIAEGSGDEFKFLNPEYEDVYDRFLESRSIASALLSDATQSGADAELQKNVRDLAGG